MTAAEKEPFASRDKVTRLTEQTDDLKVVMKKNIEGVMQRGEGLNVMEEQSAKLEAGADMFQQTSKKVEKKYWWTNMRWRIYIGIAVVVTLAIITGIIVAVVVTKQSGNATTTAAPAAVTTAALPTVPPKPGG